MVWVKFSKNLNVHYVLKAKVRPITGLEDPEGE
jgi:hypothetical protein